MNVTRSAMIEAGFAPSVRLFEAAACGTPIISDYWEGLDTVFAFDKEILIARSAEDTIRYLHELPEEERIAIGQNARKKVLQSHSYLERARQLLSFIDQSMNVTAS